MPGHSLLGSALVGAEVLKNASHTNAPKCINPQTKQLRMESHNIKMALDPPKGANFPMEPNPQKHQPGAYSNTGNRLRIIGGYHFNPPPRTYSRPLSVSCPRWGSASYHCDSLFEGVAVWRQCLTIVFFALTAYGFLSALSPCLKPEAEVSCLHLSSFLSYCYPLFCCPNCKRACSKLSPFSP